ncbi:MAG TPA: DinB family protein [Acidimicrobiales bacterium]|nr:DinB family protein [Acidimicrobiales bacterium]
MTDRDRSDLISALEQQRSFLRQTVQGLSDDQATLRSTASELCLAGIIKHVANTERRWVDFIVRGPEVLAFTPQSMESHAQSFQVLREESLQVLLDRYDAVARRTADVVEQLPSLDDSQPLPDAPWFPPNTSWSARMVLAHILAETAQHSGHADIIRESIDGAKTMG